MSAISALERSLELPKIARSSTALRWVGLCTFCGLLFFYGLGDRDLVSSHEARAAQNAQMILDEGHWLVPRLFDQHLELQKPPLYYWLVAIIGWMRGGSVEVWAVRLPAALSALATVCFLYLIGRRTGRELAGFLAALILATFLHFTWLARVGRIDMPLTMVITVALGSFYLGNRALMPTKKYPWHGLGYTSLGAGLLLKGPIALVLPTVVAVTIFVWRYRRDCARQIYNSRLSTLWWGIPWILVLAAPWYLWANARSNNQLWEVFFWYHNVERGLGGTETLAAHPWWFYGPRALVDLFPWSLFVPVATYGLWKARRLDDEAWLGFLWFAGMGLFLSCMRFKRADYLLPAYPGIALFLGGCAERAWQGRIFESAGSRAKGIAQAAFIGIMLTYGIGWIGYQGWYTALEEKDWPYRRIAQEVRRQTSGPIVFFRAESHVLAYHVGQPLTTILEWENLDIWTQRPFPVFFVMPESCAAEWQQHLPEGALVEVLRTTDYLKSKRDRPFVVMRNCAMGDRAICNPVQTSANP